jgi:hypothetical protein
MNRGHKWGGIRMTRHKMDTGRYDIGDAWYFGLRRLFCSRAPDLNKRNKRNTFKWRNLAAGVIGCAIVRCGTA